MSFARLATVGAVATTLVIAEVLRLLHGAKVNRLIDLNLVDPYHRRVVPQTCDFSALNPAYVQTGLGT